MAHGADACVVKLRTVCTRSVKCYEQKKHYPVEILFALREAEAKVFQAQLIESNWLIYCHVRMNIPRSP